MKTIVISGAQSNVGKTLLAEKLLRSLSDWSALKVTVKKELRCPRKRNCCVCAEFKGDYSIVTDKKIISRKDTDTARLQKAGAKKVVWLRSTLKGLQAGLKKALNLLRESKGIVIEGTSVLKFIKPNLAIYLKDNTISLRPAARQAEKKADIIINVER